MLNLKFLELDARDLPSTVQPTDEVIFRNAVGQEVFRVAPYDENFTGGIRTAEADVNGDGVADLITAPDNDYAPTVKVFDGKNGKLLSSFDAYESAFRGGVNIAVGDLNGDGWAEIVAGADISGGPRVRVFDAKAVLAGGSPGSIADFIAIEDTRFRGGVRVALGDFTRDGVPDLLVGAGQGGGPRVAGYDGAALAQGQLVKPFNDFFSFDSGARDGTNVSIRDLTGDGVGDFLFSSRVGQPLRFIDGQFVIRMSEAGNGQILEYFVANPGRGVPVLDANGNEITELIPWIRPNNPTFVSYDLSGKVISNDTKTETSITGGDLSQTGYSVWSSLRG